MFGLGPVPAFCERGDPCDHFFVQDTHVSSCFLVAFSDFSPDSAEFSTNFLAEGSHLRSEFLSNCRTFTTHFIPQMQNLRFDGFDAFWQCGQFLHLFLENFHSIGQRWHRHVLLREQALAASSDRDRATHRSGAGHRDERIVAYGRPATCVSFDASR